MNEKVEKVRDFILTIDKPQVSDFDLFQKILFEVELYCGDTLSRLMGGVEIEKLLTDEEYRRTALEVLADVMPDELFEWYKQLLRSSLVSEAMNVYPKWRKEFRKRCLALERLKGEHIGGMN